MGEFFVPDKIHQIAIEDGVLNLCASYDVIHRWARLGFSMLKYFDCDVVPPVMRNIPINEEGAEFLIEHAGLGVVPRLTMPTHEHEIYQQWAASNLEDEFGDLDEQG